MNVLTNGWKLSWVVAEKKNTEQKYKEIRNKKDNWAAWSTDPRGLKTILWKFQKEKNKNRDCDGEEIIKKSKKT